MPQNLQQIWKHDEIKGQKVKNRLKKDICEDLEKIGIVTRGKTLKQVQEIAEARNIPVTSEDNDVLEGWLGKPKGIKQILWEQRLLDPNIQNVSKLKKNDPNDARKVEYSTVLTNCVDFLSEKTCLMYLGERLGVEVDRSTKCHPELAGEGIEYTWGLAKGLYRKARLSDKKGKENFQELVKRCLSTEVGAGKGSLTHLMIRKFSRRARCYILTYFWIEHGMEEKIKEEELSESHIERIKKEFKTHHNAIDFDEKFINHCFTKIKNESEGMEAGHDKV